MTIKPRGTCWWTPSLGSTECSGRSIRWPSACRFARTGNSTNPPRADHAYGPPADARLPAAHDLLRLREGRLQFLESAAVDLRDRLSNGADQRAASERSGTGRRTWGR